MGEEVSPADQPNRQCERILKNSRVTVANRDVDLCEGMKTIINDRYHSRYKECAFLNTLLARGALKHFVLPERY